MKHKTKEVIVGVLILIGCAVTFTIGQRMSTRYVLVEPGVYKARIAQLCAINRPPGFGLDCIKQVSLGSGVKIEHLLAISAQESSLGKYLVGDGGCSLGYFQINVCKHANPSAKNIIGDLEKETRWVIMKLKEYGYEKDVRLAIAKYNAPNRPNYAYASKVLGPRLKEVRLLKGL